MSICVQAQIFQTHSDVFLKSFETEKLSLFNIDDEKKALLNEKFYDGFFFQVAKLPQLQPKNNRDFHRALYSSTDGDFTVAYNSGSWSGRIKMGIKLGDIYFVYQPAGKSGSVFAIYKIAYEAKELQLLLDYDRQRSNMLSSSHNSQLYFDVVSFFQ